MRIVIPGLPVLIGTVLALLAASAAVQAQESADTEPPADERLEEQDQRIKDLEQRIKELESQAMQGSSGPAPASTATASASTEPSEPQANRIEGITGDIRETHKLLTRDELSSDEFPESWPIFGTDLRMKIGGYIKADFVADFDGTLDPTQFLMRTIPVEGTPEFGADPYVDFFARETRFNLDIRRTVAGSVPLRGFIEGDFFSAGNNWRLRHAYITASSFIIGQTWTTLSFLESLPFLIDFASGDALFGGRSAQIRYQKQLNKRWKLSIAAEELQFLGIQNANNLPGKATTQFPLLAFRADYYYDGGFVLLGTSIGQLNWDGGPEGPSDSVLQIGGVVAGRQNIGEQAYVSYNFSYTEGGGENILAFAGTDANAVLDAEGKLSTFPAFSALLGFGYDWSPTLSSNLALNYGWLDTPDTREALALKRGGIGHVNLIWKPRNQQQFSTGIEFMWGTTRVQNDAKGDATRLQLMAKFQF